LLDLIAIASASRSARACASATDKTTDATENYFTQETNVAARYLPTCVAILKSSREVRKKLTEPSRQCRLDITITYRSSAILPVQSLYNSPLLRDSFRFTSLFRRSVLSSCSFGFLTTRTVSRDDKAIQINLWIVPGGKKLSVSREKSPSLIPMESLELKN